MLFMLFLAQPALPVAPPPADAAATPADIQFDAHATAERVRVIQRGQTSLTVQTNANGRPGVDNLVDVRAPTLPPGQRELRNVDVRIRAEARLAAPQVFATDAPPQEPGTAPQR